MVRALSSETCVACIVCNCASQSVTRVVGGECDRYVDEMRRDVQMSVKNICVSTCYIGCIGVSVQINVHDLV